MIKIIKPDPSRLLIMFPDNVHKIQAWIFTVLGVLFTAGTLADQTAGIEFSIFPALILLTGIAWFVFGGKPDMLKFDLEADTAEIVIMEGTFAKPDPKVYPLAEVVSTELVQSSTSGMGNLSARTTYGIVLHMKDGSRVNGTPYINRKKKMEEVHSEIRNFIMK